MNTRILIADDHAIVRKGLYQILKDEFPQAFIEEASSANELLKKIKSDEWALVISDISMPDKNGIEVIKLVKADYPNLPFLILSMHPEDQYALRAIKAGAKGYLTKESAPDELVKAVKMILSGRKYISAQLAENLAGYFSLAINGDLHQNLSDREFEVLKQIAKGQAVSDIAESLTLSVQTISTYRARILDKMQLKNNAQITHYAIQNNLI